MKIFVQIECPDGLQAFDTHEEAEEAMQSAANCDIASWTLTKEQFIELTKVELSQLIDRVQYLERQLADLE